MNFIGLCVSQNFYKGKLRQFALINNCFEIDVVSFKYSVCDSLRFNGPLRNIHFPFFEMTRSVGEMTAFQG